MVGRVVALAAASAAPAAAQGVEQVGTRALGMGGAFVAVASDASATYWNPAGLATGDLFSLVVEHQIHETPPADDTPGKSSASRGSGTGVAVGMPALGLSYYRLSAAAVSRPGSGSPGTTAAEDATLSSLVTSHLGLSLLQSVTDWLVVGSTLKLTRGSTAAAMTSVEADADTLLEQAEDLERGSESAFDMDVGVMVSRPYFRVGLVVRQLLEPAFARADGTEVALEREVRAGAAVFAARGLTVAADVDLTRVETFSGPRRSVALGGEYWLPGGWLGLRGGGRRSTIGEARPVGSAGFSVALTESLLVDGQWTRGVADADRSWGIGGRFAF